MTRGGNLGASSVADGVVVVSPQVADAFGTRVTAGSLPLFSFLQRREKVWDELMNKKIVYGFGVEYRPYF